MEKKVYVVRAKPHGFDREDMFLDGVASIGWPTDVSLEGKSCDEIKDILTEPGYEPKTIHVTQVHGFVHLPEGSIILTPSYRNRDIHIFETVSSYEYVAAWADWKDPGNPHTIRVKLLKTVSRSEFTEKVQSALLAAKKAVTNFTQHHDVIEGVITGRKTTVGTAEDKVSHDDGEREARQALRDLLKSDSDEIRLKAALALLGI
ncbi:MAG: hypothetical protein GY866_07305 [Proteobacteria bacterium]|nr:hypothetical protein [Pseudomonadota bacterium]